MQKYSLTVLINEKVSESDRVSVLDGLKKHFGNLIKEELWGMRSLAYPIKHADRAFFAHFEFEAEPAVIITLDKNIRLTEDIIRYLIVRIEEKRKKVKPVKKQEKVEVIEKEEVKEEDKTKGKAKKK